MGQREFWWNARAELRGDPSEGVAGKSGTRVKPPPAPLGIGVDERRWQVAPRQRPADMVEE